MRKIVLMISLIVLAPLLLCGCSVKIKSEVDTYKNNCEQIVLCEKAGFKADIITGVTGKDDIVCRVKAIK